MGHYTTRKQRLPRTPGGSGFMVRAVSIPVSVSTDRAWGRLVCTETYEVEKILRLIHIPERLLWLN